MNDMPEMLSEEEALRIATHRHYKGGLYKVLGIVRHSETEEELTLYEQLWPKARSMWVRPRAMFEDDMPDGTPRFAALRR